MDNLYRQRQKVWKKPADSACLVLILLVNFLIVVLVLWRWVYRPLVKMLDIRSEKIEKSVKDAQEIDRRLSKVEEERKTLLTEAKVAAAKIVEQAQHDATERGKATEEKTKREIARLVIQGKGQLQAEKEIMLKDARKEMVAIIVQGAKKILNQEVDEKRSQSLAEEVVRKLT